MAQFIGGASGGRGCLFADSGLRCPPPSLTSPLRRIYRMKTLIASAVSLLVGLLIGWYFERQHAEAEKIEFSQLMVQGTESSVSLQAAEAARAIELIGSGQPEGALHLLCRPVAHYYVLYSTTVTNDERSVKLRSLIEELARTNQVLAARIAEVSNAARLKTP